MRLVSFGPAGSEKPGLATERGILDLCAMDAALPRSVRTLLEHGLLESVREMAQDGARDRDRIAPEGVRFGPPLPNPSKIVCIGLNYADHAAEQKRPLPELPLLFAKAPTALSGCGDPIVIPRGEDRVDVEAELAFIVARRARHVPAEDWAQYVAGYMCFNDVSGRAAQFSDRQWFRGKSYDTFAPCGPYLVTSDEVGDPHQLAIGSRVNDFVMQESNTRQLVFHIPQLIEYITRHMTLLPGDIVATGTPAGVGVFRDPPRFLHPGDRVEVSIERLGTLTNPVVAEKPPSP